MLNRLLRATKGRRTRRCTFTLEAPDARPLKRPKGVPYARRCARCAPVARSIAG